MLQSAERVSEQVRQQLKIREEPCPSRRAAEAVPQSPPKKNAIVIRAVRSGLRSIPTCTSTILPPLQAGWT